MKKSAVQDAILEALSKSACASFSAAELTSALKKNKTTVYRALDALVARNMLQIIHAGIGAARYEASSLSHHHHLICTGCKKIDHIPLPCAAQENERLIHKQKSFKVTSHAMEFFGTCADCAKK